MADDGSAQSQSIWPLPAFSFRVNWGTVASIPFQEITGLDTAAQVIEYRQSDSAAYSPIKMPGIAKVGHVTMRKGLFPKDNAFWTWYSQITMNTIQRTGVVVQLIDQTGRVAMSWTLINAWPTKISAPALKSDGNEVAIETLEVAYETLVIARG